MGEKSGMSEPVMIYGDKKYNKERDTNTCITRKIIEWNVVRAKNYLIFSWWELWDNANKLHNIYFAWFEISVLCLSFQLLSKFVEDIQDSTLAFDALILEDEC